METVVSMQDITKTFRGVTALNRINFEVKAGEVHVLLGENGAGKSTLMKVLSGVYQPDSGSIELNGKVYKRLTPHISAMGGISIIYQELSVVNWLDIRENIFMGRLPIHKIGLISDIDYEKLNRETSALLEQVNLQAYKPTTLLGELGIGEKQMVEIAKAVSFNAKVIVMDEPTSSLTEEEVKKLFAIIRKLKKEGKGIVFISHKLSEIKEIGDRITILKDGNYVGTYPVKDLSTDDMTRLMVGRDIKKNYQNAEAVFGETIFEVRSLTRKDKKVNNVSFRLRKGEILGFSGLVGAGRSELMDAVFGAAPIVSGEVILYGKKLTIKNPYTALKQGIGMLTENRRETGFFGNFSNRKNISIANQLKLSKADGIWGKTDDRRENLMAEEERKTLQIKWADAEQLTANLSGGNQQKVIIGKWIAAGMKVLIFDEPTKGIDVGTKSEIYKLLRKLADEGIGIIVVSSEMPELLGLCDRIIVMRGGEITEEFPINEASEEKLVKAATKEII